jgi:caa(3)-type oxidase subunit IV
MMQQHRQNLLCWIALLLIAAAEFIASRLPIPHHARPLLVAPAVLMATLIALGFMRLASAPSIARCFVIAGMFWLAVLLGLAIVDPLTRAVYGVMD